MTDIYKGDYRARIEAMDYNLSGWAKACGVNRSTITRHFQAEADGNPNKIQGTFWRLLELAEGFYDGRYIYAPETPPPFPLGDI